MVIFQLHHKKVDGLGCKLQIFKQKGPVPVKDAEIWGGQKKKKHLKELELHPINGPS